MRIIKTKKVFYPFIHADRIGEIADQMFCLRNLYPVDEYDVHVITCDLRKFKTANNAVFEIATRGMRVIYSDDPASIAGCYKNPEQNSIIENGDSIYVMLMHSQLKAELLKGRSYRQRYDYFSLSVDQLRQGEQLKAKFKIPHDAKIVCLYVRDGLYFDNDLAANYRNANIFNYFPAIDYLIRSGYYVIRMGDSKMKPLGIESPQLIDSPFHSEYCEIVEPYFISQCEFMIGTPSGPLGLALYFNRPVIYTNCTLDGLTCLLLHKNTLLLFKKYHSDLLGRCLTYEEILCSPVAEFFRTRLYVESKISLLENSAEEIVCSVKEMIARLEKSYQPNGIARNERKINMLHARADEYRRSSIPKEAIPYLPFYSLHQSAAKISYEFIKMNPWFLGHDWPEVVKWGWEPELSRDNIL